MQLKVLSWNIWVDGYFDKVSDFLKSTRADVICLQEVENENPKRDIIKFLHDRGYNHVFSPIKKVFDGKVYNDGEAIFSKNKILSTQTDVLSKGEDNRCVVRADIEVGNYILHVFSTHLVHTHQQPSELQDLQAANLVKALTRQKTVLMGDFNALPKSKAIKIISKVLKNTDVNSLPTWSVYPEGCKKCLPRGIIYKLDNIFTSPDIKSSSFRVEESKASDHLPISASIKI